MISTTLHRLTKWPSKTTATRGALAKQEVRRFTESIEALTSNKLISTLVISLANKKTVRGVNSGECGNLSKNVVL